MRKVLLSTVAGVAALLATGSMVQAADLYTPMAEPTAATWTGFYVGAHAGYAEADYKGEWDPSEDPWLYGKEFDLSRFNGGLHAGYNFQVDSIVWGIEGDITGANLADTQCHDDTSGICAYSSSMSANLDLLASVRGRLGLASGNSLFYVTGGIAFADADFTACDGGGSAVRCDKFDVAKDIGGVVGGGWEYKPASQISVRLEGLYYMIGDTANLEEAGTIATGGPDPDRMGLDDVWTIRAGLSWHPWN